MVWAPIVLMVCKVQGLSEGSRSKVNGMVGIV